MRNEFSLSRPLRKALPGSVHSDDGSAYPIRPEAWNVLRILRMLDDPEIMDEHREALLLKWFYPEQVPPDGAALFYKFLRMNELPQPTGGKGAAFDLEFDFPEIYAAFMSEYGIDLFESRGMHFWKFKALLTGLFRTENALSAKLELRTLDTSKCENPAAAEAAKRAVQIPTAVSRTEEMASARLEEALMSGVGIEKVLEEMRNG